MREGNSKRGKIKLLVILFFVLVIKSLDGLELVIRYNWDRLGGFFMGFLFFIAICGLTYHKQRFAKWMLVVWFVFGAFSNWSDIKYDQNLLSISFFILYLGLAGFLLFSTDISEYLNPEREEDRSVSE